MNILIYGAGALGQALGTMLASSGHRIDFLLRSRFIEQIQRTGLRTTGIFGEFVAPCDNYRLLAGLGEAGGPYDYVLLTTKAYDTGGAVADIARLGKAAGVVVSMQNGCGNVEQVLAAFGTDRTLGARVITGFALTAPGVATITVCADAIHIGPSGGDIIPESAEHLATAIRHAGHPTLAVSDIHPSLFAKLLYNCTLNPLGAILGLHYGALGEREETRRVMNQVIEETWSVIAALGGRTPWASTLAYQEAFYASLLPATYNHRASMLQDVENGKPTEVDALVGYVVAQGRRLGVATPTCALLTQLVKFKEAQGLAAKNAPSS
jgi:2-dehydropantoate 2-reductase